MLGIGSGSKAGWLHEQASLASAPGGAWGAGLMAWVLEESMDPLKVLLEHRPGFICVSFGEPGPAAELAHSAGALVGMQVGNAAELERALGEDIDVVICRGSEGGGHGRNEVTTLPLLQLALEKTDKPVIGAGGIATARGIAAILGSGAQAVWVGTRFAAAKESLSHVRVKEAIGRASIDDTLYTRAFDIAQEIPWPRHYGGRALRNGFSEQWTERIGELEAAVEGDHGITDSMEDARRNADLDTAPVYAGQSAGLSGTGESAASIMADLAGFRAHLAAASGRWTA
ncbi:hypothetical protein GCM10023166_11850 [Paeniglutamicibacter cryotolerans]